MKSAYGKLICLMASGLTAVTLTGCTSDSRPTVKTEDLGKALANLSEDNSVSKLKAAFDGILEANGKAYDNCFQIQQEVREQKPSAHGSDPEEIQQVSVISQWMDEDALYQILRNSAVYSSPEFLGLVRMNKEATTQANFYAAAGSNVFMDNAMLDLGYISQTENKALKDMKEDQVRYHLLGEEYQSLTPYLGSDALVPPYISPYLYSYETVTDEETITFTITLKDVKGYNKEADETETDRKDLFKDGSLMAQSYVTDAMQWTLVMNKDGALQSMESSRSDTYEADGQSHTLNMSKKAYVCGTASNQDIGYLKDVFDQIDKQSLGKGSALKLEINIKDPQSFVAQQQESR